MWLDREEHMWKTLFEVQRVNQGKFGEKIPVTQTDKPNLQIDVVLVC